MAVKAKAGYTSLQLNNRVNNMDRVPPVFFPGVSNTTHFAYSVWVKVDNPGIPHTLFIHSGLDGSQVNFGHDGNIWLFSSRSGSVGQPTQYIRAVVWGHWTFIGIVKDGPNYRLYMGVENPESSATPWEDVVPLEEIFITSPDVTFDLDYFMLLISSNMAVSNFKFWNTSLTLPDMQSQSHHFDDGGTGPAPMWVSNLRTPGDISNITYPRTGYDWTIRGAYSFIDPSVDNLIPINDPLWLGNNSQTKTWVYPLADQAVNLGFPSSHANPGTTPAVTTVYDGTPFNEFMDLGSVPTLDSQVIKVEFFALPEPSGGPGVPASDSWGLYLNELGVKVESNRTDPANRFEQDTGVVVPGVKATTMYLWKYGGQFTWQGRTPAVPTVMANIWFFFLLVTYLGYPTGVPKAPAQDLTGLFAVNKGGPSVDRYNRGVEMSIPQPTIRTAYIGE